MCVANHSPSSPLFSPFPREAGKGEGLRAYVVFSLHTCRLSETQEAK
jgi:hypothetical protein